MALISDREDYFTTGFVFSVLLHGLLAIFAIFGFFSGMGTFPEPVVYSITIEGGKNIGGISQVPKDDKSILAPAKNVSAEEPKKEEVKTEKTEEKNPPPDEKAEVSVSEKKKEEPTPAPKKEKDKEKPKDPKKEEKKDGKTTKNQTDDVDKRLQAAVQRYLGESTDGGGKGFGAGKQGGKGMGGGVLVPPEVQLYKDLLIARIKQGWRWYDPASSLKTRIAFDIDADGTVRNIQIVTSSGNSEYDESVVRAAVKASPLPPPPAKYYEMYFKKVTMMFDPRE